MTTDPGPGAPCLPADGAGEPGFAEAWQAEAFAIVEALVEAGTFSSAEWSAALGEAISAARRAGDPDLGDTYYHHWVDALEALCTARGLVSADALDARTEAWRAAYLATPHGRPVELPPPPPGARGRTSTSGHRSPTTA